MQVSKESRIYLLIRFILSLGIAAFILSFPFYYLESLFYDARFRLSSNTKTSNIINLVSIDTKTTDNLKREVQLSDYTTAIKNIIDDKPRIVVFVTNPLKLQTTPNSRSEFAKVIERLNESYLALDEYPFKVNENKLNAYESVNKLVPSFAILTNESENFAADKVIRRAIIFAEDTWLLHSKIANQYNKIDNPKNYRGHFELRGSYQIYIDHKKPGTFPKTSFIDLIENRYPKGTFNDKIVLIGTDNLKDTNDYSKSVFNRDILAISKLEVHANIIDTLIQNSGVINSPRWLDVLLTGLISLLTVFVVFSLKPVQGLITLLGTLVAFCGISWIAFAGFRYSIGMAHPLIAIFVSYYFFIPYRLIRENRKSWEYEQKNKLLTQVEELKTNFLGMMSHDLKTPLARIQGMADIALADSSNLSIPQKEALKSINKSSEELTEFISSILDLSRVESQNIKLHLESKDINQLLEQVIHKYEFLAKEKNITFIKEMEPLFSVKIDVDLMRQVFSNLIENAIKYSPNGSKVLVSTEEIGNKIVVQVADQGIGIPTDELNKIFMKFYRTNNVRNSPTKGSGLGLYLAKYFVELHKGHISVESKPQQGSTFTVDIPTV